MNASEFAQTVRAKHPGSYDHVDDDTLAKKVVEKYPQYANKVDFTPAAPPQEPSMLNKVADTLRPVGDFMGQMGEMAMKTLPGTNPIGMSFRAQNAVQGVADTAGEGLTEKMGGSGIPIVSNPYVAATAGTLVQNAPAIAQAKMTPPMERMPGSPSTVAKPLFRKAMSWMGDVPEESVAFRYDNPKLVQGASDLAPIASKDVPAMAGKFDQVVSGLNDVAKKTLSKSSFLEKTADDAGGAFTKEEVLGAVKNARTKMGGVYTPEAQTASKTLARISQNLKKIRNTVSQNQVHDLIMDLDNEIPWEKVQKAPESLTMQDNALISLRKGLDGLLKGRNEPYSQTMKPLSEAIQNRNEFTRNFDVRKVRGEGYQPSNSTVPRLLGATKDERLATQRILGKTRETIGEDLQPKIKAAQVKADFEPDSGGTFNPKGLKQIAGRPAAAKAIDFVAGIPNQLEASPGLAKTTPALGMVKEAPYGEKVRQNGRIYQWNGYSYEEVPK